MKQPSKWRLAVLFMGGITYEFKMLDTGTGKFDELLENSVGATRYVDSFVYNQYGGGFGRFGACDKKIVTQSR